MLKITVGVSITFKFIFANVNSISHLWYYAFIEETMISCNWFECVSLPRLHFWSAMLGHGQLHRLCAY